MADEHIYVELTRDECLSLLAGAEVGRLACVADGRPLIFPVNYALDDDVVVFRTAPGTKLAAAGFGPVAFEVDGSDRSEETGWSVVVLGVATEITDALDQRSEHIRRLELHPWVPRDRAHWVAIQPQTITGRRLRRS